MTHSPTRLKETRDDVKYDADELHATAQSFMDSWRSRMREISEETLGEIYVKILPYIETDSWTNYREALRVELEHEYKFSSFKKDWATNFRRAVFVENREELAALISGDILARIKHLEDCKQEFEQLRYSPIGDRYQDIVKERDRLRAALELAKESLEQIHKKLTPCIPKMDGRDSWQIHQRFIDDVYIKATAAIEKILEGK